MMMIMVMVMIVIMRAMKMMMDDDDDVTWQPCNPTQCSSVTWSEGTAQLFFLIEFESHLLFVDLFG